MWGFPQVARRLDLFSCEANQKLNKSFPVRFGTSKQDYWRFIMFKSFVPALVLASALAAPAFAFAQDNAPVTRAEVRADLVQLEKAGYNPSTDRVDYPKNIQAAEARVSAQQGNSASGYGASTSGSSASGQRAATLTPNPVNSVYFGH
jgi:Domain of unknown function (DUF4148)